MFLKDADFIKIMRENTHVEVLNANARFYNGFIQLEMDRWGNIRPCNNEALQQQWAEPVNEGNDLSAVEYELITGNDNQKNSK